MSVGLYIKAIKRITIKTD